MAKKIYTVNYRGEFTTEVGAESEQDAIEKAKKSEDWTCISELWEEMMEVEEE
jgi:hypothetical protein